jgi:hypothetical protein
VTVCVDGWMGRVGCVGLCVGVWVWVRGWKGNWVGESGVGLESGRVAGWVCGEMRMVRAVRPIPEQA